MLYNNLLLRIYVVLDIIHDVEWYVYVRICVLFEIKPRTLYTC